jgi:ectoine hydroxylase-related dioxygenase (phytanoyl-CoA dioxygenase family)
MLTVWVAVTDATIENGCMVCVPGSHRGELTMHCPAFSSFSTEIAIPDKLIAKENAVAMPVKRGGIVLLHQLTEHSALENNSDSIRWSFDLRYHATGFHTGREVFPGFVARSKENPASELQSAAAWGQLWQATKERLVSQPEFVFNTRWDSVAAHQLCA